MPIGFNCEFETGSPHRFSLFVASRSAPTSNGNDSRPRMPSVPSTDLTGKSLMVPGVLMLVAGVSQFAGGPAATRTGPFYSSARTKRMN